MIKPGQKASWWLSSSEEAKVKLELNLLSTLPGQAFCSALCRILLVFNGDLVESDINLNGLQMMKGLRLKK